LINNIFKNTNIKKLIEVIFSDEIKFKNYNTFFHFYNE